MTSASDRCLAAALMLLVVRSAAARVVNEAPDKQLLSCFSTKFNYWLVGFAFHTTTVSFKNECLRACLTAPLRGDVACLSAMHVPNDDECILADQSGATVPELLVRNDRADLFTIYYYENTCARPPVQGGRLEAKLSSFSGELGLVTFAQQPNAEQSFLKAVFMGLEMDETYALQIKVDGDVGQCTEAVVHSAAASRLLPIAEFAPDSSGVAVLPWQAASSQLFGPTSILNHSVVISNRRSNRIVSCGVLKKAADFDAFAQRHVSSGSSFSNTCLLLALLSSVTICIQCFL